MALLTVGATVFLAQGAVLPDWKIWVLIILAYDLGGGVLANFTYSTKQFYQSRKRRIIFLSIHFLQPLLMSIVFPEFLLEIALISSYTVLFAFIVDAIQETRKQIILGVFFALAGVIALYLIPVQWNTALLLLLTIFLLKLPLAFAVRWYATTLK